MAKAQKPAAEPRALKGAFTERASEAAELINRLLQGGLSTAAIAAEVRVTDRTIYRWWREGHAPHPIMLDGLRKLANQKGV